MGKESIVLKSLLAAVILSYFTASENENLRTERKQNYLIKNEKGKKNWLLLLILHAQDFSFLICIDVFSIFNLQYNF